MADINASQAGLLGVVDGAVALNASQVGILVAAIWPSEFMKISQAGLIGVKEGTKQINVSQVTLLAAVRGRVFDPTIRAWTFTLDGHDFYGLRLGNDETLLYDLHSEQWYLWGDGDDSLWRTYDCTNWFGGTKLGAPYGSAVVVGGDSNGSLYFLDPASDEDDSALTGADGRKPFRREVTGQVLSKGYQAEQCYGVQLLGSIGQVFSDELTVQLSYSDDRGVNYVTTSPISVDPDDVQARIFWRSLGSYRQPGRLFKVTDYGALKRIDALLMPDKEGNV